LVDALVVGVFFEEDGERLGHGLYCGRLRRAASRNRNGAESVRAAGC
jgi:hypothetical protein